MNILVNSICKQGGRDYNQDFVAFTAEDGTACMVVCDGLGSYVGSEVASRLCATKIVETFQQIKELDYERAFKPEFCQSYVQTAHNYVVEYKEQNPSIRSSCTTVASVVTDLNSAVISHIGDTRVYYLKAGKIVFQTKDHSLAQVAVDMGQIAQSDVRCHKDQNKLTRVLGSDYYIAPDCQIISEPLSPGDGFIICTDGFWEYVFENEMEKDFAAASTPSECIARMEARLNKRINKFNDNYSAVVAMVVD